MHLELIVTTSLATIGLASALPPNLKQRSDGVATIDLGIKTGTPSRLASGIIYGIPDTPNQIPSSFYTGMGFNYGRAGGAQIAGTGWIYGKDKYNTRFQSTLSNYKTSRQYGAKFQILFHDLWGADTTQSSDAPYPGDNGDWSSYDMFLTYLISNITTNKMTAGLDLELWNEPDLPGVFWNRSLDQYLQMWGRGYARMRAAFGTNNLIVGPSLSAQPVSTSDWWTGYLNFIATNKTIPDQYTWYHESFDLTYGPSDPQVAAANFATLRTNARLPVRPININEYAVPQEQNPAAATWYISRFERLNWIGLRGNWQSTGALHDFLANLLGKPNAGTSSYNPNAAGYWPNGEWRLYNYYTKNMTGTKVQTTGSADGKFDVFATSGGTANSVKMIAGARATNGVWDITVNNMTSVGRPASGNVNIHTYRFEFPGGTFGNAPVPVDLGVYNHAYSNNAVTFFVQPDNENTAYAFEFVD